MAVQNLARDRRGPGGDLVGISFLRRRSAFSPFPLSFCISFLSKLTASRRSRGRISSPAEGTRWTGRASRAYVPGEREEVDDDLAIRRLTFWRDGFTVQDGPLVRYDDPANAEAIHAGHALPSILNVRYGQRVDGSVTQRTSDDYVPPPPPPFSGSGRRLGAPVPASTASASTSTSSAGSGASTGPISFEVDQTQTTTSMQIRLADETRIVCRMDLTHTVRDPRNFINGARPEDLTRYYTIGTAFPNRTPDDNAAMIKEARLANNVVVQRWV
ncbi:SEP domain-containing protein [Mycena galopus ATCC 62051]|nr:SEP domain-containing protein [Mycena galopus ATCC 62051]